MNDEKMLRAKEAIFCLIGQLHAPTQFDDGKLYIFNYCEGALERAFRVLGIEDNYIGLEQFCKMWEENSRAIWAIHNPNKPFGGITWNTHYSCFKDDWERTR